LTATTGLRPVERFNVRAVEAWHRVPALSVASRLVARHGTRWLVEASVGWTMRAHGFDQLAALPADRGIIICANHRSYLDNFAIGARAMRGIDSRRRFVIPARTEGLFDVWYGLALNAVLSGVNIYPPVVRASRGAAWGKQVIGILTRLLRDERVVVLIHPEGGRNKGPDPYALLTARPGLGRIVHESGASVVPVFLHGFPRTPREYLTMARRRLVGAAAPVDAVMGAPIDFSAERELPGGPALYYEMAQRITAGISALMPAERAIRARRGTLSPPDESPPPR
jgi:1-acyl-sn-glycerol-3-phosphate acyltransferase